MAEGAASLITSTDNTDDIFVSTQNFSVHDGEIESDIDMILQGGDENGGHIVNVMQLSQESNDNSDWTQINRRKRSRISTGGRSGQDCDQNLNIDDFQKLSVDAKLSATFSKINNIGHTVDKCLAIHSTVQQLEIQVDEHTERITRLEYKSLDLEARSRRNNLVFGGINEVVNEDCFNTISNFLMKTMKFDSCPAISRVHRLGRYNRDRTRPIIVLFINSRDVGSVLSNAKILKGTSFSINKDFPREIADARKQLWPEFKKLRAAANPTSKISLAYPAKIIKDGKVHFDMFPKWNLYLQSDRVLPGTTAPISSDRGRSQPQFPRASNGTTRSANNNVTATSQSTAGIETSRMTTPQASPRASRRQSRSPTTRKSRDRVPRRRLYNTSQTTGHSAGADPGIRRPWDTAPPATQTLPDPQV